MLTTKHRRIGVSFALLILLSGCASEKNSGSVAQIQEGEHLTSYSEEISSSIHELQMKVGTPTTLDITVKNTGTQPWVTGSQVGGVDASYRWLDSKGTDLSIEGERTQIDPHAVQPGENRVLKLRVVAPPNPGSYTLRVSLVQEGVAWFYLKGGKSLALQVTVD